MILQINEVIEEEHVETYIGEVDKAGFVDDRLYYNKKGLSHEIDYSKGDLKQIFLLNENGKTIKGIYGLSKFKE